MSVDRGNSKHGPRLDDEMAHEVQGEIQGLPGGRAEEFREIEPSDEPIMRTEIDTGDDRDPDYRDQRARIGSYVSQTEFPATGARILTEARNHHAPDDVLDALGRLDLGHRYANAQELWKSLHLASGPRF